MTVARKIEAQIEKWQDGTTFKYQELAIAPEEYRAAAKAIERLIKKGTIQRASTGLFYKSKITAFGKLKPNEEALLKPYLFEGKERIAYVTGTALFNRMGLTTQVPKNIRVACRGKRIITKVGSLQIMPVKSYTEVTNQNYFLLELLDILKDFKTIPDTERNQVIKFVVQKFKNLSKKEQEKLIEFALKYPPRVRSLTGAILTMINPIEPIIQLKKSINPLTIFEYGLDKKVLPNMDYWNIR